VIACDGIVAAGKSTLSLMREGRTYVALNSHATPTAAFVGNPDWHNPTGGCEAALQAAVGAAQLGLLDADHVAVQLLGDSIYTNPLLRAMELNGVQIDNNKAAFEWGRRCAHDMASVTALFKTAQVIEFVKKSSLDEMIAKRVEFLTGYQDADYAAQYRAYVAKVRGAEAALGSGGTRLAEAVARYLFKLMAYKDEYEVARLHTDPVFTSKIQSMFEGDYKVVHHLAPPLTARRNAKGELVKRPFGPWMRTAFGVLAKLKGLRGTPLDVFGRSEERRTERALIGEYKASIDEVLRGGLASVERLALAIEIARIPEEIRGYGHVKARHLGAARAKWDGLMQQWRRGGTASNAATTGPAAVSTSSATV
jgi:indolepyruvate ferredoxin oxidoreductase